MTYKWFATAAFGLEGLVGSELKALGCQDVSVEQGGARFSASVRDVYKALLWLRCADRVLLILGEAKVDTFEDLFQLVRSISFETFLPRDGAYHVSGKCVRSRLMSVRDCQSVAKKALIERLREAYHVSIFPENRESYHIGIAIHTDVARVTLDAAGTALNKRGYRVLNGEAALRETLAAALVRLSPWQPGLPLYDPCCGTGTLLIEAAMIAAHRAPGLNRMFAIEAWRHTDPQEFADERKKAGNALDVSRVSGISGSDIDTGALAYCRKHLNEAGFGQSIHIRQSDLAALHLSGRPGVFLLNPPYGERMADREYCRKLCREIGWLMDRHPGYSLCALSSDPAFERMTGRKAAKKRRLYNGRLECVFYIYT